MNLALLRKLLPLLLSITFLSGCVVLDECGRVDRVATQRMNAAIGVGVVAGTVFWLGSHHRDHHYHSHRHHPPKAWWYGRKRPRH